MPADAEASEVVDSTLAEPIQTAAAMVSALHNVRHAKCDSGVLEACTGDCMLLQLTRFVVKYFEDLCRSPPQRAAASEICLHKQRPAHIRSPRLPGQTNPRQP